MTLLFPPLLGIILEESQWARAALTRGPGHLHNSLRANFTTKPRNLLRALSEIHSSKSTNERLRHNQEKLAILCSWDMIQSCMMLILYNNA